MYPLKAITGLPPDIRHQGHGPFVLAFSNICRRMRRVEAHKDVDVARVPWCSSQFWRD